jgi:diguanylate cyclase (GGDEF)-like protein
VARQRGQNGASILIVDDEAALCEGLRHRLDRAGYATEVATSAEDAAVLLAGADFDLMLCDVLMPGRSGLQLVRQVLRENTSMAAIMMSALDDPDVADSAFALGAYGYVVKPFTPNELLMQVRNALKRLELEREKARGREALEELLADRTKALAAERRLRGVAARQARENAALLTSLEERQELLRRLLEIQRSVPPLGASLQAVLDSIVLGAQQLLGDEVVALTLAAGDSGPQSIVAARGLPADLLHAPMPGDDVLISPGFTGAGVREAVAAPVRDLGAVIGALTVGSTTPGRVFSEAEHEALAILAEHAGIALREAKSQTIVHEAFHDELTKLPNRASFLDALEDMSGERTGIVLVDVDDFRAIREELGATRADELLVAAAERLVACAPAEAVVARLGPDEFGVIVRDAQVADVEALADRAIAVFQPPFQVGTSEIAVTASGGAACSKTGSDDLVRDASVALYRAKRRGKGRWEIFSAAIKRALVAQFDLEADLEGAVGRGEIRVVYQPVVELRSGRVAGFEALARWEHPVRGVVPPLEFIPLAEGLGIVGEIGRHVVNVAVQDAAGWQAQARGVAPWVSVNFSARELEQTDFVAVIAAALERTELPPEALVVEITEGVLIGDTDVARERLNGVRALGARIAIDDFGTGHASLEYLRRLPFDILKIAREFCDGADRSPEEAALARTVVNLAKRFELDVIAEGIERIEQREALIEMGCALGQGYFFARPLEPEAVEDFMDRGQPEPVAAMSKESS